MLQLLMANYTGYPHTMVVVAFEYKKTESCFVNISGIISFINRMGLKYTLNKFLFSNHTTYETAVVENVLFLLFLTPECCKSVDDHSKEQVEHNDDDEEEVQEVKHYPAYKQRFLKRQVRGVLGYRV